MIAKKTYFFLALSGVLLSGVFVPLFAKTSEPLWTATLYDLLTCYGDIRSADEAKTLTIAATRLFSVEEAAKRPPRKRKKS